MSVIKDLKSKFSSIAWCPEKEHASVMAVATMKDLTPVESESPKSLSLYDWRLDNVAESQMVAEESLPAGICCLNWMEVLTSGFHHSHKRTDGVWSMYVLELMIS